MITPDMEKIYNRLVFFKRYRDTPTNQKESIAEHQYFVTFLTKMLCDELEVGQDIELDALRIALIHDIGESYSDDFTYDIKYKKGSEDFRQALETVEDGIIKEISEKIQFNHLENFYIEYKERNSTPAKIVKCADWLSVILFCKTELQRGENKPIRKILINAQKRLKNLLKTIEVEQ